MIQQSLVFKLVTMFCLLFITTTVVLNATKTTCQLVWFISPCRFLQTTDWYRGKNQPYSDLCLKKKKYPKSYELTTVLLYRKNNTLVTLNNGCQNLLILVLASGFIIVENLSTFFFLFLWVLWLHQFWTMSSLVFPQGSSSSCHVKYLIHLNRLMFAKVEKCPRIRCLTEG